MFFIQTNIGIIIKYISIVYILPIQYQPPLKEYIKYQCLNIDNTLSNLSVCVMQAISICLFESSTDVLEEFTMLIPPHITVERSEQNITAAIILVLIDFIIILISAHIFCISSLCQVCTDTNLVCKKLDFSH